MDLGDERAQIADVPVGRRVLEERAEDPGLEIELVGIADHDLPAKGLCPGADDFDGLRVAIRGDEERRGAFAGDGMNEAHRFRGCRALVEQRSVRNRQAGQVDDHRLVVEQRLEAALGDLRLVWSILSVPTGILQHVALDDRGGDGVRVPHPEIAAADAVLGSDLPELVEKAVFGAAGRQVERPLEADVLGNGRVDERVERALPERLEHLDDVLRVRADVAVDEAIGVPRHGHLALLLRGSDRRGLPCRAGESNRYPRASP